MVVKNIDEKVVIDVKSRQYLLKQGEYITCDRIDSDVGEKITFNILGFASELRKKGIATCEVIEHKLGKKIRVFHKTKRNGDANMGGGTRRRLTIIKLIDIKGDA